MRKDEFPTATRPWRIGEVRHEEVGPVSIDDVLRFVNEQHFIDRNTIHRDPATAHRAAQAKKYTPPSREFVIVPGAMAIGVVTAKTLSLLGAVMVTRLNDVKFRHLIYTDEVIDLMFRLVSVKHGFGLFHLRAASREAKRSPVLETRFTVLSIPNSIL